MIAPHTRFLAFLVIAPLVCLGVVHAERVSEIANTKHNLSVAGSGTVRATSESQVCVFCHTPHAATQSPGAPLWNRQLSGATYTVYTSSSLDSEDIHLTLDQPGGSSKLCLSCHDGTLALGTVNVSGGAQDVTIGLFGTDPDGTMPGDAGGSTGFTRDLGTDLTNDHPISLTYDTAVSLADGELRDPTADPNIGLRVPGVRPLLPLEATGSGGAEQVQCASCHDPHVHDPAASASIKFLRLQRFQVGTPAGGAFNPDVDMVCLGCHDKQGWATSAHAVPGAANEVYTAAGASDRDFPSALPVWQAGCLNCHDTHTVHGARRLAREGTDSAATPKSGGNSAIEETCYQCHSLTSVINNTASEVKDIKSDFQLLRHMPITSADQSAGGEVHDILDADFTETQTTLGRTNLNNRHAECTDCHNPHRVMKNTVFNGTGSGAQAAHDPTVGPTNIASGALRGAVGVEPVYGSAPFLSLPSTYLDRNGDGGIGASVAVTSLYVTREYQICLRCHSDYAYSDTGAYPTGGRPNLGDSGGGTPATTNGLTQYTNQAMEFQAPSTHKGEGTASDSGAGSGFITNNHRSWHPVIDDTGRTPGVRQASAGAWLPPWNTSIGNQTMYCSDCHGSNTANNSIIPSGTNPWGPHGSNNDFILKGNWNDQTGGDTREVPATDPNNGLCLKCHDFRTYADRNGDDLDSGFGGDKSNNLHAFHADEIEAMHCMWCHTAVPHGWKNKALLVNLNDVGPEAGQVAGTEIVIGSNGTVYNKEPYYFNAKLKVRTFATSGTWEDTDCGSNGLTGGGNNTETGKDWMGTVCSNPP